MGCLGLWDTVGEVGAHFRPTSRKGILGNSSRVCHNDSGTLPTFLFVNILVRSSLRGALEEEEEENLSHNHRGYQTSKSHNGTIFPPWRHDQIPDFLFCEPILNLEQEKRVAIEAKAQHTFWRARSGRLVDAQDLFGTWLTGQGRTKTRGFGLRGWCQERLVECRVERHLSLHVGMYGEVGTARLISYSLCCYLPRLARSWGVWRRSLFSIIFRHLGVDSGNRFQSFFFSPVQPNLNTIRN